MNGNSHRDTTPLIIEMMDTRKISPIRKQVGVVVLRYDAFFVHLVVVREAHEPAQWDGAQGILEINNFERSDKHKYGHCI